MPRKGHSITEARCGDCFAALVEQFGYHLLAERGLSYNYLALTPRVLLKFNDWRAEEGLLDSPITASTTQEKADFLGAENSRGLGSDSLKITVCGLKAFFGFLTRHLADHDPTLILRAPGFRSCCLTF